jgi:hypothetical protein
MKRMYVSISLLAISFISTASAQERYYVWTYPYGTEPENEFEVESNSLFLTPSVSNDKHSLVQQFELEYGVTERFQLGLYQVFGRNFPSGNFFIQSSMLEALYELAGKDKLPFDPMLYLEYEHDWNSRNRAEVKMIMSREFGKLNGTVNGIVEYEFGGRTALTPEFSAGLSYEIADGLRAGIETFVMLTDEDEAADDDLGGTSVGPTVALNTPYFDIASGLSFGIAGNSNALSFCTTIGIDL